MRDWMGGDRQGPEEQVRGLKNLQDGFGLFELTENPIYPVQPVGEVTVLDHEPTPYARAKRLAFGQHNGEATAGGSPVMSYYLHDGSEEVRIFFPLARRENGYGVGPPVVINGQRVMALLSRDSGRWECVQGPPYYTACWAVLDADLHQGSTAVASLWWAGSDSGVNVTAYDWLLKNGTMLPTGTKIKVEYFPQDAKWWVTAAECV
jgi:hypothetical protein